MFTYLLGQKRQTKRVQASTAKNQILCSSAQEQPRLINQAQGAASAQAIHMFAMPVAGHCRYVQRPYVFLNSWVGCE
jgi:hypothetical protein